MNANFRGKGSPPRWEDDFWHQKTRVLGLSYGENFNRLSRAHQRHSQTDDRQTDGIAIAYSERNVVRFAKKQSRLNW